MGNDKIEFTKDFLLWLITTMLGRMGISALIMFIGAVLILHDKTPYVFYSGLAIFLLHALVLFIAGIINMFKEWLR